MGAAPDVDVLHSAQVNFGDITVPREEILRRIQTMGGKFEVRNGRLLYKQKGGEKLDLTTRRQRCASPAASRDKGGNAAGSCHAPNSSDVGMASSGGTQGCWWAQKAWRRRRRQKLSSQTPGPAHGMKSCNVGVDLSGPTQMKTLMHNFNERNGSNLRKCWSWRTFSRCTGGGRQN